MNEKANIGRDSQPRYSGRFTVHGLVQSVEIVRDGIGVPHIFAQSEADAFFAQGFVQAQDRFWQMESDRLKAYGRMAELLGEGTVKQDVFWRRLKMKDNARRDFESASPQVKAMFRAFASGVNAYLADDPVVVECALLNHVPEPWEPWDCIVVFKLRHFNMGRWEHKLWRLQIANQFGREALSELFPPTEQFQFLSGSDKALNPGAMAGIWTMYGNLTQTEPDEGGSNNWVLSGTRTASGNPLMAGDPHRALDVPNVYYQNHVRCPSFDVIGFSFPGVPGFPHFAHNKTVAWSITHAAADSQDVFIEEFNDDFTQYRRESSWHPCRRELESIRVRGSAPVSIATLVTDAGPVVAFYGKMGLAMKAAAIDDTNTTWESLYRMLASRDVHELDDALAEWVDPVNNLLYADTCGNIGYRMRGRLPIRSLTNAFLPVPAWESRYRWAGSVPYSAMHRVLNPRDGFLVTANNQVVDDRYPHYVALDFAAAHRKRRITQLITSRDKWRAEDMSIIHADVTSVGAQKTLGYLANHRPYTRAGQILWKKLMNWSGTLLGDDVIPTLYSTAKQKVTRRLMEDITSPAFIREAVGKSPLSWQFGRISGRIPELLEENPGHPLAARVRNEKRWEYALDETATDLPNPSLWRDVHVLRPTHPLADRFPRAVSPSPPVRPMDGDADTVQAASFGPTSFQVTGTSVARYVFDLSDWDRSGWVVPLGICGVPGHAHYLDQAESWTRHILYPMHYSEEAVRRNAQTVLTLNPS